MPSYLITFCSTARPEKRMSCQVPVPAFCEPGACSSSCDIWRPLTGRSCTSRSLTFAPMRAELRSSTGVAADDGHGLAARPAGWNSKSSVSSCPAASVIPRVFDRRETGLLGVQRVGRRLQPGNEVQPFSFDSTVRTSPVRSFLTETVAPAKSRTTLIANGPSEPRLLPLRERGSGRRNDEHNRRQPIS